MIKVSYSSWDSNDDMDHLLTAVDYRKGQGPATADARANQRSSRFLVRSLDSQESGRK